MAAKQSGWLPRWCAPRSFWPRSTLKAAKLAPPSADDSTIPDESDPNLWVIYRSMVDAAVLATIQQQDAQLYARIYPDPPISDNDAGFETLAEAMAHASRADDRAAVRVMVGHTGPLMSVDELKDLAIGYAGIEVPVVEDVEMEEEAANA